MQGIKRVLVIGATSQIGDFLLPKLLARGLEVHAFTRKVPRQSADVVWQQGDIEGEMQLAGYDAIIHIAYLDLLPVVLKRMPSGNVIKQVIGFGSTSMFTKQQSTHAKERALAQGLVRAEADVASWCAAHNAGWTILRPTLIYGRGKDGNISTIARVIRRFRCFPLIGGGRALRQPVHAEDLAQAVVQALGAQAAQNKAYNVSGGETLTYRDMVARIFQVLGKKPCFIPIPMFLLKLLIAAARRFPSYRHITMEMATRLQQDLVFSHEAATQDFGYRPGPFRPEV